MRFFNLALVFQAAVQLIPVSGMDPTLSGTLQGAAREGQADLVARIIREGADVNSAIGGRTPLHEAASAGHLEVVELLLANGGDPQIAYLGRFPPIMVAAQHGHGEIVRRLAEEEGVSRDTLGKTLMCAAFNGHADIVEYFLKRDAELMNATYGCRYRVSDLVPEGASSVYRGITDTAWTPVMMGVLNGHLDVVSKFVQYGARADFEILRMACSGGHGVEIVKLFLDNGANIEEPDDSGIFPIGYAISSGTVEVVELLLERGATGGIREGLLFTYGDFVMTKLLLDNGADPNITGWSDESTPLFQAVKGDQADIVRLLLNRGADLRPNMYGRDPLESAVFDKHEAALAVFVEMEYITAAVVKGYLDIGWYCLFVSTGRTDTPRAIDALQAVMGPITMIKSVVSALTRTSPMQAYNEAYPVLGSRQGAFYQRGLIAFSFEARKGGIDLFSDAEFRQTFDNVWSESKIRMVSSIISRLAYLGCSDVNFFYFVSPFLADADEDMLRHAETAFNFLAASRASDGAAILNRMIANSQRFGLRPVVKALFSIYLEEQEIKRSLRPTIIELPEVLIDLVLTQANGGPSDPSFQAKAMQKLDQAIGRLAN